MHYFSFFCPRPPLLLRAPDQNPHDTQATGAETLIFYAFKLLLLIILMTTKNAGGQNNKSKNYKFVLHWQLISQYDI